MKPIDGITLDQYGRIPLDDLPQNETSAGGVLWSAVAWAMFDYPVDQDAAEAIFRISDSVSDTHLAFALRMIGAELSIHGMGRLRELTETIEGL